MNNNEAAQFVFHALYGLKFLQEFAIALEDTPNKQISVFLSEFQNRIAWSNPEKYAPYNTHTLFFYLYGSILLPQQTFFNQIPAWDIDTIRSQSWGTLQYLEIHKWETKEKTLPSFIKAIRNSLAHGRFDYIPIGKYTFEDVRRGKNAPYFSIVFHEFGLRDFIFLLAAGCLFNKW